LSNYFPPAARCLRTRRAGHRNCPKLEHRPPLARSFVSIPMSYSVVIPAYQAGATVADAVRSARAQELAPREVLVVDDGSTDDTPAIAETAGARVIRQSVNQGAAVARNIGLAAASGR